jgi:hypothetical protein
MIYALFLVIIDMLIIHVTIVVGTIYISLVLYIFRDMRIVIYCVFFILFNFIMYEK